MSLLINEQLKTIADLVLNKKAELAEQRKNADEHIYSAKTNHFLSIWRENLIEIYANSITRDLDETYLHLKNWGDNIVNLLVDLQIPLDLAIEEVRFYRETIGIIIRDEAKNLNFSLDSLYDVISRFDSVVDRAVHWLSLSYSRTHAALLQAAEKEMDDLTIPIVRVTEEIGVLPLIGDIDTLRAQQLMERALSQGTELNLSYIIIDLSGVPIIDTMVAAQLFKVISALKLIGIDAKLTGIRPEIAQTMVNLGIDFQDVHTFSSLHLAIKSLNK
ncbi:rsbT co-antagonist protein RsbR [Peribacillus deserti]|uniref:RsbT co-antagonist protein RsbR n=1 Tax=Peribacillus deserti TaxID=673318 RepID=A0ABS2QDG8_9BACI|nr:STAS domain-containing protein [Peribacillus deserti]MBM7691065.1 rsbT co-antagonist protein RsbR [Peribacillus deserti]